MEFALDREEIEALAKILAAAVADILEARLAESPQWAFSISEAAAWACIPERTIRHAIETGRLPSIRVGRQIRIRRADLFRLQEPANGEGDADGSA